MENVPSKMFSRVIIHNRQFTWSGKWQPTPLFLPRKFHGRVDYSASSRKESDTVEQLSTQSILISFPSWQCVRIVEIYSEKKQRHLTSIESILLKYSMHIFTCVCVCVCVCVIVKASCSVVSNSFQPHGLQLVRVLCPWNFLGQNTRVGSCSLLQGIFPTQGSNPGLSFQANSLPSELPMFLFNKS